MNQRTSRSSVAIRQILCVAMVMLGTLIFITVETATSAAAQSDSAQPAPTVAGDVPSPTEPEPLPLPEAGKPSIIPTPNSGTGPQEEGDPGTMSQYIVMAMTFGGLAVIVLLMARESRKKRSLTVATPSDTPHTDATADATPGDSD